MSPQAAAVLDYNSNMIMPGSLVLVKAGNTVHDLLIGGTRIQRVNRSVVVHHLSSRLGLDENGKEVAVAQVAWAGSGGYWNKCDASEVELQAR